MGWRLVFSFKYEPRCFFKHENYQQLVAEWAVRLGGDSACVLLGPRRAPVQHATNVLTCMTVCCRSCPPPTRRRSSFVPSLTVVVLSLLFVCGWLVGCWPSSKVGHSGQNKNSHRKIVRTKPVKKSTPYILTCCCRSKTGNKSHFLL